MNTSRYWKALKASRAIAASDVLPHLRLTNSPVRPEPVKRLLHRWIPNPQHFDDLEAFGDRVLKMRPFTRPPVVGLHSTLRYEPIGGCWIFRGYGQHDYPLFKVPSSGSWVTAYMWLSDLLWGAAPEGMLRDHVCENKKCTNPDHLETVTIAENVRRSRPGVECFDGGDS